MIPKGLLVSCLRSLLQKRATAASVALPNHRSASTSVTLSAVNTTAQASNTTPPPLKIEYSSFFDGATEDRNLYLKHFKDFIRPQTTTEGINDSRLGLFFEHFKTALEYNVPYGKMVRSLPLAISYKFFKLPEQVTEEEIFLCNIIAWCFEAAHTYSLITDDIIDRSTTRRHRTCWYLKEHIGLSAMNDAFSMHSGAVKVLHKYFKNKPYYVKAIELLNEHCWHVTLGQTMDVLLQVDHPSKYPQLKQLHTMENYLACIEYKTSGTFWPPLAMAMYMNDIWNPQVHSEMREHFRTVGRLLQYQNDGLDIYGNPETVRVGTDVEDGKCTIFSVLAMEMGDSRQVKIMEENFGRKDPVCAKRVKDVYLELGFPAIYQNLTHSTYSDLFEKLKRSNYKWAEEWFRYSVRLFFEDK